MKKYLGLLAFFSLKMLIACICIKMLILEPFLNNKFYIDVDSWLHFYNNLDVNMKVSQSSYEKFKVENTMSRY